MAKDFNVSLKELVGQYRSNEEPGFRYSVVSELRTLADYIAKSDPWPAEIKASEEAQKKGLAGVSEPTEAEMKRAAADEEAAALARMRGIGDDYTSKAEADVPQSAKDDKLEREFKEFRGEEGAGDNIPGRPIPVKTADQRLADNTKPNAAAEKSAAAERERAAKEDANRRR